MHRALYDEAHGYYTSPRDKLGAKGDFYTASQLHEVYGQLMADEFARCWKRLHEPDAFQIVELGGGRGEFARHVLLRLQANHPHCFERTQYAICEISPALRDAQQAELRALASRVRWIESLSDLSIRGIVFANEFFDALPVHLLCMRSGRLRELYVNGGRFIEGDLSSQTLADHWNRVGVTLEEGQRAEISLSAIDWMRSISDCLEEGWLIAVDYGDLADRLYTPDRMNGTLRCFFRHTLNDEPLERVGEQDITASVNFSALIEYGRENGLEMELFSTQNDYLIQLGLLERAAAAASSIENESPQALQHRLALKSLFLPQGIAAHFRVLVQRKPATKNTKRHKDFC
jgi:SAM-dependent MidA family methyltransferase